MGNIVDVGPGVTLVKKGDRVVMPFNVAGGRCKNLRGRQDGILHRRQPRLPGRSVRLRRHGALC